MLHERYNRIHCVCFHWWTFNFDQKPKMKIKIRNSFLLYRTNNCLCNWNILIIYLLLFFFSSKWDSWRCSKQFKKTDHVVYECVMQSYNWTLYVYLFTHNKHEMEKEEWIECEWMCFRKGQPKQTICSETKSFGSRNVCIHVQLGACIILRLKK